MKKLYYLDEEEKERILNLHESRTKKQYLNEEGYLGSAAKGAAIGASVGLIPGGAALMPVAIPFGAAVGLLYALGSSRSRKEFIDNAKTYCSPEKAAEAGKQTVSADKLKKDATTIFNYIKPFGYATDESRRAFTNILSSLPSMADFCALSKVYDNLFKKDLLDHLSREIYKDDNFKLVIINSMKEGPIKRTEEALAKAKAAATGATACVTGAEGVSEERTNGDGDRIYAIEDGDITYNYNIDKMTYFPELTGSNGQIHPSTKGANLDYSFSCSGSTIVRKNDPKEKQAEAQKQAAAAQQKIMGGMGVIVTQIPPDVLKQLRTLGGSTETANTITQNDINALYTFLYNKLPKK